MKAIRIHKYGGAEELVYEDAPMPEINPDDVLVKVFAAGVNPVDWKVREGLRPRPIPFPITLGWDLSGTIEAVGSQVTGFKKCDEVYAKPDLFRNGTYAEYAAVKASEVAFKPKTIGHVEAASVPLASLTAWQALFTVGELQAGQQVLILGASGGVGPFAVQLAKWKKAKVIAVCSAKNIEFVRSLGADEVIDYAGTKFDEVLHNLDLVFDVVGGEGKNLAWKVLKQGGTLVSITGEPDTQNVDAKGKKGAGFLVATNTEQLKQITGLIDNGIVKPFVCSVFPLWDARKAHDMLQHGNNLRGKIVLKIRE